MFCLVLYDIPDDNKRRKIADICLDYGLDRTQYSVFAGDLSRNLQEELFQKIKRTLGKKDGSLILLPIHRKTWDQRLIHQRGSAPSMVSLDDIGSEIIRFATKPTRSGEDLV